MNTSWLLDRDTWKLMRIPFSFFLMPIYWFALSQTFPIDWYPAIICFIVLHLFIYPASNGYNSYMDKDESSIGGLKNPPKVTKKLFYLSVAFDITGLLLALLVNFNFFCCVGMYLLASRAYSYKGIRLKKYPIVGFLTVVFFQGAFTYLMVKTSMNPMIDLHLSYQWRAMLACSFLIGGVYPLTQVYQHAADRASGDRTISILLGIRGTFVFSAIMFGFANMVLYFHFQEVQRSFQYLIFQLCLSPLVIYFGWWAIKVWRNESEASFENTMRMNAISSLAMSMCFILMCFLNYYK